MAVLMYGYFGHAFLIRLRDGGFERIDFHENFDICDRLVCVIGDKQILIDVWGLL